MGFTSIGSGWRNILFLMRIGDPDLRMGHTSLTSTKHCKLTALTDYFPLYIQFYTIKKRISRISSSMAQGTNLYSDPLGIHSTYQLALPEHPRWALNELYPQTGFYRTGPHPPGWNLLLALKARKVIGLRSSSAWLEHSSAGFPQRCLSLLYSRLAFVKGQGTKNTYANVQISAALLPDQLVDSPPLHRRLSIKYCSI